MPLSTNDLDAVDRRLLRALQVDGRLSNAELARRCNLSAAACFERVRRLRNGGQTDRYRHVEPGVNSRLDEIQAAVLRERLPRS